MKQQYKSISLIIILLFCASIFIPFLLGILETDAAISELEKRKLAQLPEFPKTIADINEFPQLFDKYYADHFGLRYLFTEYYKLVKYNISDSPSRDVTIGKNGWLFLGSIKNNYKYDDPIGDARNITLFSQPGLKKFANHMEQLNSWLNWRGIKYIFVIAPNKHTIYFEQLPDYISKVNEKSATDQLVEYLEKYTNISVVDLRKPLLKEKDKHQIYFKTDSHWNHYATNVAQYEIMLEIEKLFPSKIKPELQKLQVKMRKGGDLSGFIGINDSQEPFPYPIFRHTCNLTKHPKTDDETTTHFFMCKNNKLNAIIFRDSFFKALQPYFARKFNRSTYIWGQLDYASLKKHIEIEQPDIVIEEIVERKLPYLPKDIEFKHYVKDL